MAVLQPLSSLTSDDVANVTYVLTDVDDTITSNGKLKPSALTALWTLQEHGLKTICVTGGSAGWGDVYLRQWPIEAVVSESGGVCFYRKDGVLAEYRHPSIVEKGYAERRSSLVADVLAAVPEAKLSSDQFARKFDIAFDYGSEPPYLDDTQIAQVVAICQAHGARTAVSSIHVNTWFGDFDKKKGAISFLSDVMGMKEDAMVEQCIYCGDAPNDQVMFSFFPLSFGVGNVLLHRSQMRVFPRFVAQADGGDGFSEIVDVLVDRKNR